MTWHARFETPKKKKEKSTWINFPILFFHSALVISFVGQSNYLHTMLKLDPKDEAFAIKMEELMKQALSEEIQEMTDEDEDPPVDLATDDNDDTITEEEMIQLVKKEPNEKPLSVRDLVANPALAELGKW